jgi:DNA-directed RNA polymerase specialized sigma24 family protein
VRSEELIRFLLDAHWREARRRGLNLVVEEHHAAMAEAVRRMSRPGSPPLDAGEGLNDLFLRLHGRVEKAPLYIDGSVRAYFCVAAYNQALTAWRRRQTQKVAEATLREVRGRLDRRMKDVRASGLISQEALPAIVASFHGWVKALPLGEREALKRLAQGKRPENAAEKSALERLRDRMRRLLTRALNGQSDGAVSPLPGPVAADGANGPVAPSLGSSPSTEAISPLAQVLVEAGLWPPPGTEDARKEGDT